MRFALVVFLLCTALPALAGTGEWYGLDARIDDGPVPVVLVTPTGTAPSLASQGVIIYLEYSDWGSPEVLPMDQVRIGPADAGASLTLCVNGVSADADADTRTGGLTTISGTVVGGGYSEAGVVVLATVHDRHLTVEIESNPIPIRFNSPDITGDLVVDLADFALFGRDYHTDSFRSDLVHDGVVDLADFALFARHYNTRCP